MQLYEDLVRMWHEKKTSSTDMQNHSKKESSRKRERKTASEHWFSRCLCFLALSFSKFLPTQINNQREHIKNYSLEDLLMSDLWIWGITPPPAMVPLIRVSSSSSPRIASCKCLGVMRFTLRSLLAFPANSSTSAVRYSNIAAVYTAAVAPTLPWEEALSFNRRWTRPTGNCNLYIIK